MATIVTTELAPTTVPTRYNLVRSVLRSPTACVSGAVILLAVLIGAFAPLIESIYGYSPTTVNSQLLDANGNPLGFSGGITFSTDNASGHIHIMGVEPGTGRDLFMQLVYGIRTSLVISLSGALLAAVIGVVIGLVAGYAPKRTSAAVDWFIDIALAFPFLIFCLALIPVTNTYLADENGQVSPFARGLTIIIIFGLFTWMTVARLVRAEVKSLSQREFVDAARVAGAGHGWILFRELLPNLWSPIIIQTSAAIPILITAEAALSFLGIGMVEPTPDLGRLLNNSIPYALSNPTYMLVPGITLVSLVLAFNVFGDALRDAVDPHTR
ncbi:ABC transporter permease [Microbacterium sp. SSW1-49]|uniref:ABC transporter permease n=1 Tax=Microbacterium croceum TaxID=2851645 RepID=A0ABT0FCE8_9MICO|nr:ABC transporter permease [Microbacterium croceum]MCK2035715.1 ABC transporter permease [Microbacterium croceum]